MVQSGIAYAAGQLLAVVAPRTVLVVDAPTDWSLAGPLWELALDDAPVDEILDVLIRRGIRTAPSFAIVRVENDAVRALVRGSVPVCFERVGEPVRLDATGATTWLEGLISSARRVLVGAVETNSTLPYLVSTGVVLVSGLALPCGPSEPIDRGVITPGITEPGEPGNGPGGSTPDEASYFSRPPAPVGSGSFSPSAGREPRVVDLTRSGGRAPAKAFASASEPQDSWALASARSGSENGRQRGELNGHAPALLEPSPVADPAPAIEPSAPSTPSESGSRFDPIDFSKVSADDPGELQDLGGPEHPQATSDPYAPPQAYSAPAAPAPAEEAELEPAEAVAETPESLDDLLVEPADAEEPSPAPTDLPDLDPPSLSLPMGSALNGFGVPAQPRSFGNAPAAWPPAAPDPEVDEAPAFGTADSSSSPYAPEAAPISAPAEPAEQPSAFLPAVPSANPEPPAPGELPLRVRGRSLRPELNGNRLLGGPAAESPAAPPPAIDTRFTNGAPADQSQDAESPALPEFFRGPRSARPSDSIDDVVAAPENKQESSAPSSWLSEPAKPASPAAWVAPVRRSPPDRPGFNGGPPALPSALRSGPEAEAPVDEPEVVLDDHIEEPTEATPPPSDTPAEGISADSGSEGHREPPRLLGVWCDAGHVTSPDHEQCRVCGLEVPPQAPILVARPPLGVLIFDNGDQVPVDRPNVLGRDPKPVASPDPEAPVLHPVPSATGQVSRTHAEVRAEGWDVVLTDLDAMNGTALTLPGTSPVAIEPGVPTLITPGTRVDLGGESGFVFEVEA